MNFNWQQTGWPNVIVDKAALRDEMASFKSAFLKVQAALEKPQSPNAIMSALVDEAMKTSAIEGVRLDESVVMSSICKALGMKNVPLGFSKDLRAEGVAHMVLAVKDDWDKPISARLIKSWHAALMANDSSEIKVGAFRSHSEPMRVVRRDAYGELEVRFEAPPSAQVPAEIARFVYMWRRRTATPEGVAFKCAMIHPHFESIHPFEDGNGRVGRALVAKTLAEGLGSSLVLPVSTVIDRYRKDYYDAINEASRSLDWTGWARFFIPVLTETLLDFISAAHFVAAKSEYLSKYEPSMSERAKAVIVKMFRDGPSGVAAGLSAAKWMRMAKVSKPTATRDLSELEQAGAIIREGEGAAIRYRLDFNCEIASCEPIDEPVCMAINEAIKLTPGINKPRLMQVVGKSKVTVESAISTLVAAGRIDHRGSKKTGGYFTKNAPFGWMTAAEDRHSLRTVRV